jgi:hypothetical protein
MLVFSMLLSISLSVAHYQSSEHMISPHDWLTYRVGMPFAGRALAGDIARLVFSMLPASFRNHHQSAADALPFLLLEVISLLVAFRTIFIAVRKLDSSPFAPPLAVALLAWQFTYMLVVNHSFHFWYTYDTVSIAVMTVGLALIVSGGFYKLLALIIIGTWNRETAIVLGLWWGLYLWRATPRRKLSLQVIVLLLTSAATKWIVLRLHHLPLSGAASTQGDGGSRYFANLEFWSHPKLIAVCGIFGFLWIFLPRVLRGSHSPRSAELGRCLWSLLPYFLLMIFVGNLREIRIFVEFTPLVAMILALGFCRPVSSNYIQPVDV